MACAALIGRAAKHWYDTCGCIYRKIRCEVKSGKTPFESMEQLVSALARLELDDDLYDEWEGESIHFFDNICDYGEAPGRYDRVGAAGWVEIPENLDSHLVTADE